MVAVPRDRADQLKVFLPSPRVAQRSSGRGAGGEGILKLVGIIVLLGSLFGAVPPILAGSPSAEQVSPISFELSVSGVSAPMQMAEPPDGSGRFFIVSKYGTVRIAIDGEVLREPFLDITDQVNSEFDESGMFSIAFHPDFVNNGLFFVTFTNINRTNTVMRYHVSRDDPNRADPESRQVVLAIPDDIPKYHNAGGLAFGLDGYLYISTGDDTDEEAAQDLMSWKGKILRIDPLVGPVAPGQLAYRIPPDNPFAELDSAQPEIWAYGLRNPWRFSFDRETGDLYIGDVGQSDWEEVNFQAAGTDGGQNYGWPMMEARHCFRPLEGCDQAGLTLPIAEYSHDEGCAVIGGFVYRGSYSPDLYGRYLFADICSGDLLSLQRNTDDDWMLQGLAQSHLLVTSFAQDQAGELYVTSFENGGLRRIVSREPTVFDSPAFATTWARTDAPVSEGEVARSWTWGPWETGEVMVEPYEQSPDGWRTVVYLDKARMEITEPDADPTLSWYVTNGLLVAEMIVGRVQLGDDHYAPSTPAEVNVAGDANDPKGPTYASFGAVLDRLPLQTGQIVDQRIDRSGNVTVEPMLADFDIRIATVDAATNHAVAAPFWEFMQSQGVVREDGEDTIGALFPDPVFATGRPITDPYWADVTVAGVSKLVLIQCFERRCLTYTPDNAPEWQVEAGNVGQHYRDWRYGGG
jgi:glucose/arabinose dehydrogenase